MKLKKMKATKFLFHCKHTAAILFLMHLFIAAAAQPAFRFSYGAIVRGDTTSPRMAIVFTGHEFAEGGSSIASTLKKNAMKASFFFTGDFYRNPDFEKLIGQLCQDGHYLGAHSDAHLLYCDWNRRDSLLVTQKQFVDDLTANYTAMFPFGIHAADASYFMPPYEWYNDTIAAWTRQLGLQLINFSPGTRSAADYTWPQLPNYRSSRAILQSIRRFERTAPARLNGFILLLHIGTDPRRTDKFYRKLPALLHFLKVRGYLPVRVDELLIR